MQQIGAGDAHELQVQENCEGDMPLPHVQKASVEQAYLVPCIESPATAYGCLDVNSKYQKTSGGMRNRGAVGASGEVEEIRKME